MTCVYMALQTLKHVQVLSMFSFRYQVASIIPMAVVRYLMITCISLLYSGCGSVDFQHQENVYIPFNSERYTITPWQIHFA